MIQLRRELAVLGREGVDVVDIATPGLFKDTRTNKPDRHCKEEGRHYPISESSNSGTRVANFARDFA